MIKYPQDIFKLDYDKIKELEGWGNLSAENLKYSINQKKKHYAGKTYICLRD